jgi:hypothetical protein
MKGIFCIATVVFLISCSSSPLVNQLQGSDSLSISFIKPGTDSVIKTVASISSYAIKDLLRFADSEQTNQYKCGYDGKAFFYKKGKLAGDIIFNYSGNGCQHFLYLANGKLISTKMSYEAIDFLKALAIGSR